MKNNINKTNNTNISNQTFIQSIPDENGKVQLKNISWLDVENDGNVFIYECPVCKNNNPNTNTLNIVRDDLGYKYTIFICHNCNYSVYKTELETTERFNGYKFNWKNKYDKYNCVKNAFMISDKEISKKQVGYIQSFFSHKNEALAQSGIDYRHGYDIQDTSYLKFELI